MWISSVAEQSLECVVCEDIICCRAEPGVCCVCGYHLLLSRAWSVLCVWISSVAEQSLECVVCEDIICC